MAGIERTAPLILNILFLCTFATSTALLYNVLWEHDHRGYALTNNDWLFMASYILPAALSCMVFLCALTLHILSAMANVSYFKQRTETVLSSFIDTFSADETAVQTLCARISSSADIKCSHCDSINMVLVYLAVTVFVPFLPILSVLAEHNRGGTKYGFSYQTVTVMVQSMAHLFLLGHYGNYSLSLVVLAMLYLTVGVAALRFIDQSHRSERTSMLTFLWFIFEDFLLMMAMFTITFVRGTVFYSAVIMLLLAAYLICNFEDHKSVGQRTNHAQWEWGNTGKSTIRISGNIVEIV